MASIRKLSRMCDCCCMFPVCSWLARSFLWLCCFLKMLRRELPWCGRYQAMQRGYKISVHTRSSAEAKNSHVWTAKADRCTNHDGRIEHGSEPGFFLTTKGGGGGGDLRDPPEVWETQGPRNIPPPQGGGGCLSCSSICSAASFHTHVGLRSVHSQQTCVRKAPGMVWPLTSLSSLLVACTCCLLP